MNKKQLTVEKHIEEYLAGRSPEQREEFLNRPLDRQYACIMAWKHRQYAAQKDALDIDGITDMLRTVRKSLPAVANLSDKDIKLLRKESALLDDAISDYERLKRAREIKALEEQQKAIVKRLAELRNS